MKLSGQVGLIWLILGLSYFHAYPQQGDQLPAIVPTATKPLQNQDAPAGFCMDALVQDDKGRLWLKPCGVAEQFYALRMVQFDGYEFRPITIVREGWDGYMRTGVEGFSSSFGVYGFLNRFPIPSTLFRYLPGLDSIIYTPLENGLFGGVVEHTPGKFWVWAKHPDHFAVYDWDGMALTKNLEIPHTSHYNTERNFFYQKEAAFFKKNEDKLWIYEGSFPVICYDLNEKKLKRYGLEAFPGFTLKEMNLQEKLTFLSDMAIQGDKVFLLHQIYSPDIQLLDPETDQFKPLKILPPGAKGQSIHVDSVGNVVFIYKKENRQQGGILLDKNGQYWDYSPVVRDFPFVEKINGENFKVAAFVSTKNGVYLQTIADQTAIASYQTGNSIRAIAEVEPGKVLINMGSKGYVLLKDQQLADPYQYDCIQEPLNNGFVSPFVKDNKGATWLLDRKKLIKVQPEEGQKCTSYELPMKPKFVTFLPDGKVAVLAGRPQKLYYYDPSSQQLNPAIYQGKQLEIPAIIHYTHVSKDGKLWLGTIDGLFRIDPETNELQHFGKAAGFEDHRILVIHEDNTGRLWLGTVQGGVQVFDLATERVTTTINKRNGLTNNTVVNILEDQEGDFWIGTYDGLSLLNADGHVIANLNQDDGLSHYEFNRYTHIRTTDGSLVMGTLSGVNLIDPTALKNYLRHSAPSKIYITDLSYYDRQQNKRITQGNVDNLKATIRLPAAQRNLSLQMALSNYGYSDRNRFAYKLEGIHKDWIYLGDQHQLTLSTLPAGRYNLVINGIDHRGNWAEAPVVLKIHAKEFFYKQLWFYIVCLLPFLAIAIAWAYRLRKENVLLEDVVQLRTEQLRKDKVLIEQQAKELQQLDQMKSRFFANISHELRTPITLITGPTEVLSEQEVVKKHKGLQKAIRVIWQNGKKLLNLVDEMLDLARLESQKIQLHEAPIPLLPFSKQLFESYQLRASQKEIEYHFDYDTDHSIVLLADPQRLEKIINNLLSNALKFTPKGGKVIMQIKGEETSNDPMTNDQPSMTKTPMTNHPMTNDQITNTPPRTPLTLHPSLITFTITDTGRGIPEKDLPHIFERYFQSKEDELVQSGGSGIGLSLSQDLAQLMGGKIIVKSTWGQGSTFTLNIPAKAVESAEDSAEWQAPLPAISNQKTGQPELNQAPKDSPRIMIVEDNLELQEFVQQLLAKDYQTLLFKDGQEALDFLQKQDNHQLPIDLILSDIMMPRLDGYGLLEAVKADNRLHRIPMVMLTARNKETNKLRALRMGVDDYLTKPFSPLELQARLKNLLYNYQQREAFRKASLEINPDFGETVSADQAWLEQLEKVVLDALDKQLDLKEELLADALMISGRQLRRKIKSLTGLTMGKYVQEVKLQKARHLLENKAYPTVTEISYACGFKSASHFALLFSNHFGKRPSELI